MTTLRGGTLGYAEIVAVKVISLSLVAATNLGSDLIITFLGTFLKLMR